MNVERQSQDIVAIANEELERRLFMQDLNRFMGDCGKPLSKIPIMGYKELDLFQLFKEVSAYGGFNEVVKNVGTWSKIWKRLGNFDPSITDSSFRLKKNYERYLLEYEYMTFPEHRKQAIEMDKQLRKSPSTDSLSSPSSPESSRITRSDKRVKKTKKKFMHREIQRDRSGQPKMPIILGGGELIIENLGVVIPRSPYVNEKHIWPIGFTSVRYFSSMNNPDQRVKYTSQIVDAGDRPQFVVTAADDPQNPIVSHSPSGAWRTVLKRVMGKGLSEDTKKNISVSGTLRFGLAHPVISNLIRDLPGASDIPSHLLSPSSPSTVYQAPSSPTSEFSPSTSPMQTRKRKMQHSDSSEEEFSDEELLLNIGPMKQSKIASYDVDAFSARDVQFESREEMDDLESAVATLNALKYCVVH